MGYYYCSKERRIWLKNFTFSIDRLSTVREVEGLVQKSLKNEFVTQVTSVHKYTKEFVISNDFYNNSKHLKGITVLLSEAHGSTNIGHASRDSLFLAHILQNVPNVSSVIIYDALNRGKPHIQHRLESIRALIKQADRKITAYIGTNTNDSLHGDYFFHIGTNFHFDILLEKAITFPGDKYSRTALRSAAINHCGFLPSSGGRQIFVEQHFGTREWYNQSKEILQSIKEKKWARNYDIVTFSFHNISFCDQVGIMYKSRVAIMHHGASVQGNGNFLPSNGIMVEVFSQFEMDPFSPKYGNLLPETTSGPSIQWALATSTQYISAPVAFSKNGHLNYYHTHEKVSLNITRWNGILSIVEKMLKK